MACGIESASATEAERNKRWCNQSTDRQFLVWVLADVAEEKGTDSDNRNEELVVEQLLVRQPEEREGTTDVSSLPLAHDSTDHTREQLVMEKEVVEQEVSTGVGVMEIVGRFENDVKKEQNRGIAGVQQRGRRSEKRTRDMMGKDNGKNKIMLLTHKENNDVLVNSNEDGVMDRSDEDNKHRLIRRKAQRYTIGPFHNEVGEEEIELGEVMYGPHSNAE